MRNRNETKMADNSNMAAKVGVVIKIERAQFAKIVGCSDQAGRVCDKAHIFKFGRADRNNTAQLPAEFRLRQQAVINGQRLVWKFVYPVHVLPFDEEIHRVKESPDTDCHVVIQKVGGLRHFQINRGLIVLEFELHFSFEEKPVRQFKQKKRVERGVEKWILAAARGKSSGSITSHQKLCGSRKC